MKRRVLRVSAVLALLLLLTFAGIWLWLHSEAGEAFVLAKAKAALAQALPGVIDAQSLRLEKSRLSLQRPTVSGANRETVFSADSIEAELDLFAVLRGTARIKRLVLNGPTVLLERNEHGLTLTQALVRESTNSPSTGRTEVVIDELVVHRGSVTYRDSGRETQAESIEGTGRLGFGQPPLSFELTSALTGTLKGTSSLPLTVSTRVFTTSDGHWLVTGEAQAGETRLDGVRFDATAGTVALARGSLSPDLVKRLLPDWPVVVPLGITGTISNQQLDLTASAGEGEGEGEGRLRLTGTGDLAAQRLDSFECTATNINPSRLTGAGENSTIQGTLRGALSGFSLDAVGTLSAQGEWRDERGARLARLVGEVYASSPRHLTVPSLSVDVPGASLVAKGSLSVNRLDATGTVDGTDLERLQKTVRRYTSLELPSLAGQGRLRFSAAGAPSSPRVKVDGQLNEVKVGDTAASTVVVGFQIPDVQRPFEADGRIETTGLTLGGTRFERVGLQVLTTGRNVDAVLDTQGLGDARVHLVGRLDTDANGMLLQQLDLSYEQTAWALERPAPVRWAGGHLQASQATLVALPPIDSPDTSVQRLDVQLDVAGRLVNGSFSLANLYASSLPSALVPPSWRLGGTAQGTARVSGQLARPAIVTDVTWSHGAAFGVSGLGGQLTADIGVSDATGNLRLASPVGELMGAFRWPTSIDGGPGLATMHLKDADVSKIAAVFDAGWPVSGLASATATVSGTTDSPQLAIELTSTAIRWAGACASTREAEAWPSSEPCDESRRRPTIEATGLRLGGSFSDGGLRVEGNAIAAGATVSLSGETDIPTAWRKTRPSTAAIGAHPWRLHVKVLELPLERVAPFAPAAILPLRGPTSLDVTARGPWLRPEATLGLSMRGVQLATMEAVDGTINMAVDAQSTRVLAETLQAGQPFLRVRAAVEGPLTSLPDETTWAARALNLTLQLEPTAIARLWPSGPLRGTARGSLALGGTLAAPEGTLAAQGEGLSSGTVTLGQASLSVEAPTSGPMRLAARLTRSAGRPDASLEGTVGFSLKPSWWKTQARRDAAPLHLELNSQALDVAFLTGAHPSLRRVGGLVTTRAQLRGTLASPDIDGSLSWVNGRLGVLGYGDYRDITIDAVANTRHLTVSKLEAQSGAGSLRLTGEADQQAPGTWSLSVDGAADRFPAVLDDQLLATLTLDSLRVRGTRAPGLVTLSQVQVAGGTVRLPEVKRKDLQGLERPGDVVVVRSGRRPGSRAASASTGTHVVATLDTPRNLWVKSADVNVELGLSEGFRIEYADELALTGTVFVKKGTVTVASRRFDVSQESTIAFTRLVSQPVIDAQATYNNEREKVKVTAVVTGRGKAVRFRLTSDPPLPESEVFALLATGRRNLKRGSGSSITSQAAVSVVGGLVLGPVRELLLSNLPVDVVPDVLSVDLGQDDAVRIEVGKYLGDRVYVGTRAQPGANPARGENPFEAQLEVVLLKNMGLEVTAGTAPAGAADVVWSIDF